MSYAKLDPNAASSVDHLALRAAAAQSVIPRARAASTQRPYPAAVSAHAPISAGQNEKPFRSATGSATKNTTEGTSTHRIDVNGSEIKIAPNSDDRRASSLANATTAPEITAFKSRYTCPS